MPKSFWIARDHYGYRRSDQKMRFRAQGVGPYLVAEGVDVREVAGPEAISDMKSGDQIEVVEVNVVKMIDFKRAHPSEPIIRDERRGDSVMEKTQRALNGDY